MKYVRCLPEGRAVRGHLLQRYGCQASLAWTRRYHASDALVDSLDTYLEEITTEMEAAGGLAGKCIGRVTPIRISRMILLFAASRRHSTAVRLRQLAEPAGDEGRRLHDGVQAQKVESVSVTSRLADWQVTEP